MLDDAIAGTSIVAFSQFCRNAYLAELHITYGRREPMPASGRKQTVC